MIRIISSLIKLVLEQGSKFDAKDPFISDRTPTDVRTRKNNANFTFVQYRANIFFAGGTEIFLIRDDSQCEVDIAVRPKLTH